MIFSGIGSSVGVAVIAGATVLILLLVILVAKFKTKGISVLSTCVEVEWDLLSVLQVKKNLLPRK